MVVRDAVGIPHARGDGPRHEEWSEDGKRIPHARGDGPPYEHTGYTNDEYSPRTWGWTTATGGCAGAFLYSPRTWGWTESAQGAGRIRDVFPTHVGMDR